MCINWGVYAYRLGGVWLAVAYINWGVYAYRLGGVWLAVSTCILVRARLSLKPLGYYVIDKVWPVHITLRNSQESMPCNWPNPYR